MSRSEIFANRQAIQELARKEFIQSAFDDLKRIRRQQSQGSDKKTSASSRKPSKARVIYL